MVREGKESRMICRVFKLKVVRSQRSTETKQLKNNTEATEVNKVVIRSGSTPHLVPLALRIWHWWLKCEIHNGPHTLPVTFTHSCGVEVERNAV